jgi:hypothetical protein
MYVAEVNPEAEADVVIDNRETANPQILNRA